jgi:hypothetical protein
MNHYDLEFYDSIRDGSRRSAEGIAPLIMRILYPKSVLDVGCGQGVWLNEFAHNGVDDIHGVDGDYVSKNELVTRSEQFTARNLKQDLNLGRRFDLAMSLEVAEHLGADAADSFVASLVRHSACVLFSAAIPDQGGTSHVNEQWPSYWVDKFTAHRYRPWDFRATLWDYPQIDHWYAQNMLLFVKDGADGDFPKLLEIAGRQPLNLVHPMQYMKVTSEKNDLERALWDARLILTGYDISQHIPAQRDYILVDDGCFPVDLDSTTSTVERILEKNGVYGGPPENGQEAIAAISAHHADGFDFLVQTWLAFWWQGTYAGMASYLEKETECLVNNERCRIYRFKKRGAR